jgi:hypothetical protein
MEKLQLGELHKQNVLDEEFERRRRSCSQTSALIGWPSKPVSG